MKLEIEVNVAEDTIDKVELQERLRKEAILALFGDRKIVASQATRELGISRIEFMQLVKRRAIPHLHYTYEDWQADLTDWDDIEKLISDSGR